MSNNLTFSVAQRINVEIFGKISTKCALFLKKIYTNFDPPLESPKFNLKINITNTIPTIENKFQLGKDGYANNTTFILNTGHFFTKEENCLTVGIPTKVKRGRIPFKRRTPGRHISDEIIEPFLQLLLLKTDATFVHASSVYKDKKVAVLMGWRGTGKTNAILKDFSSKEIWSDDLSIIDTDGYVYPYLRPIRLYSYNLPLIDKKYLIKHRLNLKKYITPSWQPVHYLPLQNKTNSKKAKLKEIAYLNNPTSTCLPQDAEDIMNFEQLFFDDKRLMLKHLKIIQANNSVKEIITKALLTLK